MHKDMYDKFVQIEELLLHGYRSKTSELPKSEKSSISNEFNSFNHCFIIFHSNKMFLAQTMENFRSLLLFLGSQDITVCFLYPIVFNSFWSVYLLCWTISFSENGFSSIFFFYCQRRWATRRFFNWVFLCVPLYF